MCLAAGCDHGSILDEQRRLFISHERIGLAAQLSVEDGQLHLFLLQGAVRKKQRQDGCWHVRFASPSEWHFLENRAAVPARRRIVGRWVLASPPNAPAGSPLP